MSIIVSYSSRLDVRETIIAPAARRDNSIVHEAYSTNLQINAASSVPATKVAAFRKSLTAGAATIDLTSLVGTNSAVVDGTGLKVQAIKVKAPTTNTAAITVAEGASSGYELLGNGFTFAVKPGQEALFFLNEGAPDVALDAKNIDLSGTGTESLDVIVVLG